MRDLALIIAEQDSVQVPKLVEKLEKRPYGVFHRIALDLLQRHPDGALITARLTDRRLYDARGTLHEYELLALDWFGKLKEEDQQKILNWTNSNAA